MRRFAAVLLLSLLAGSAQAQQAPSYVVFFQEWSAALDDAAQGVIRQAADFAKANPAMRVQVTGFADQTGSQKANILLSELRAQMVVDQLTSDGVAPQSMSDVGAGSVQSVFTNQESRRVQVSFTSP
jgi:outer membrane protein OmpA-like peptidoglycan-associated protein